MKSLRPQSADLGGEDSMGKSGALVPTNATLIPLLAHTNLKKRRRQALNRWPSESKTWHSRARSSRVFVGFVLVGPFYTGAVVGETVNF